MVNIEVYLSDLLPLLKRKFADRLAYVGLQGSYLRGEAHEGSDLDIMVVIDDLSVSDLAAYRAIIESMPHSDKSCGFICATSDLRKWNPLEMCNLLHSTRDYYGVLADLIPGWTEQDLRNFVKMSVNNLYHEICHRYIHADPETNREVLPFTYKGVFFILQNLHYLNSGNFVATKSALLDSLDGRNREVLARCLEYGRGEVCDFEESFGLLFAWCREVMEIL